MSLNLLSSIPSESINIPILLSTLLVIIFGTYHFFRRYAAIPFSDINNYNEQAHHQPQPQPQPPLNSNMNSSQSINIQVQIQQERKPFTVNTSQKINEFISSNIKPLLNNQNVTLIYQGQVLKSNKTFGYYSNRISNGSVLLCRISQYNNQSENDNDNYDENNDDIYYDKESVSVYSLLFHGMFLILTIYLIFCYKSYKELFTSKTLKLFQVMLIVWTIICSDCIAKLICYKKIVF